LKKIYNEFKFSVQVGVAQNPECYMLEIETHKRSEVNKFIKKAEKELINEIIKGVYGSFYVTCKVGEKVLFEKTIRLN